MSFSRSLIPLELANIAISIGERILPFPPHHILSKLSLISLGIGEPTLTLTLLYSKTIFPLIIFTTSQILLPQTMREIILHPSNIFTPIIKHNLNHFLSFINRLLFGFVKRAILRLFILFQKYSWVLLIMSANIQDKVIDPFNGVLIALFIHS